MKYARSALTTSAVDYPALKSHLKRDSDIDRADIIGMGFAATEYAENLMECTVVQREVVATFFEGDRLNLPAGPIVSITSIVDGEGNPFTGDYELVHHGYLVVLYTHEPVVRPLTVTYQAGYATIPHSIAFAIKSHVAHIYFNREAVTADAQHDTAHGLAAIYSMCHRGPRV